jgi:hypothetical protein
MGAQCSRERGDSQQICSAAFFGAEGALVCGRGKRPTAHEWNAGYPQILWITLWIEARNQERHRISTAGLSNCSNISHPILSSIFSSLRPALKTTIAKASSSPIFPYRPQLVCITNATQSDESPKNQAFATPVTRNSPTKQRGIRVLLSF